MSEYERKKKSYIQFFFMRFAMILYDILAINGAYICALIVRYYVNSQFNENAVPFIEGFFRFAPYYTVCCLLVFWLFKLYNSRWKYASLTDLNRILAASLVTCLIQVVGSTLFVMKMPMSYYAVGAVLQFVLIAGSRFSFRIVNIERVHMRMFHSGDSINVMIVGVGETSYVVRRHLERDEENLANPVCMVDLRGDEFGNIIGGIPVVYGIEKIEPAIKKYGVECVILADAMLSAEIRKEIRAICKELDVEVQDFSGYFQNSGGAVSLRNLLEYSKGEVELVIDDQSQLFDNGEQAAVSLNGKYMIRSVSAKENHLVIKLSKDILVPNDVHEEWVVNYEKETGEDISFF